MPNEDEQVVIPLRAEILIRDTYRVHRIFSIVNKTQHHVVRVTAAYRELSVILARIAERIEKNCKAVENGPGDLPEFVGRMRDCGVLKL